MFLLCKDCKKKLEPSTKEELVMNEKQKTIEIPYTIGKLEKRSRILLINEVKIVIR